MIEFFLVGILIFIAGFLVGTFSGHVSLLIFAIAVMLRLDWLESKIDRLKDGE